MNILRLQFEALGPFAGNQDLDFSPGSRAGLFLINGPTGSGKTSILDALCFALYGASSGDERKAADLRSHHAPDDAQTSVTLEFGLQDRVFRIRRWMSSRRVQTFSEKVVIEEIYPTSRILADKRIDANQVIQNLLHLDASQFRQVIVLPQGRFRDFLVASSQEREKILQNLFATSRLDDFVTRLGELRQTLSEELVRVVAKADFLREQLAIKGNEPASQRVEELAAQLQEAIKEREIYRSRVQTARGNLAQAQADQRQFQALEMAENDCNLLESEFTPREQQQVRLGRAKAMAAIRHFYEDAISADQEYSRSIDEQAVLTNERNRSTAEVVRLDSQLAVARTALETIPERQANLVRHQSMYEVLESSQVFETQLANCGAQTRRAGQDLGQVETVFQDIQKKLVQAEADREAELAWGQAAGVLENLVNQLDRIHELWQKMSDTARSSNQQGLEILAIEAELAQASLDEAGLRDLLAIQTRNSDQVHARHLALQLRPDEPCPVCGSREHPIPANVPAGQGKLTETGPDLPDTSVDQLADQLAGCQKRQQQLTLQMQLKQAHQGRSREELLIDQTKIQKLLGSDLLARLPEGLPPVLNDWWPCLASLSRLGHNHHGEEKLLESIRTAASEHARKAQSVQRSLVMMAKQITALKETLAIQETALQEAKENLAIARERQASMTLRVAEEAARLRKIWGREDQDLPDLNGLALLIKGDQSWIGQIEQNHRDLEGSLANQKRQQAVTEARLSDLIDRQKLLEQQVGRLNLVWDEARQQAGFADTGEALACLMPTADLNHLESSLEEYRAALLTARSRRDELRSLVAGKNPADLGGLQQALQEDEGKLSEHEAEYAGLEHRHNQARSQATELDTIAAEQSSRQLSLDSLTALHRLLNGQESSGSYVNLQRFALSVFLDEILLIANQHLREMSRSRYQLVRDDQTVGKRRTGGLELYVADTLTGMRRGTESLSGGESFITALSLALGLSAVVHARSGGVRLDTLFVDEGFGSLDEDSLEDAMQVLGRIHEKGRVIGIISHVRELRERISTRLVVDKGPAGSSVAWAD